MRLLLTLGALVLGTTPAVTVVPRPSFPGPARAPGGPHRLVVVSSTRVGVGTAGGSVFAPSGTVNGLPGQIVFKTANRLFGLYGRDGSTGRYLVAWTKHGDELYAYDFLSYARPPRIKPGEGSLVYEQPVWAQGLGGTLYVANAHLTYAASSYGQNAYVTAIDVKTSMRLWRSPALVANATTFLVTPHYLLTGYGFTNEPDYLYLLDRRTGRVVDRLLLDTAPEKLTWHNGTVHVRTYDRVVVVRLRGA